MCGGNVKPNLQSVNQSTDFDIGDWTSVTSASFTGASVIGCSCVSVQCLVEVAASSVDGFQCLVKRGLMSRLLSELDADDDILTQLNCLELLTVLMAVSHGRQYLQQSGTLERLEDKLVNTSDDPLAELVLPGQSVCRITLLQSPACC